MKRHHHMPFGAEPDDSGTHFRLWAPGAGLVELLLDAGHGEQNLTLTSHAGGWYRTHVPGVGAGSRYRYRIDGDLCVPDPASRCNPDDVHGASLVVDPLAFDWQDAGWRGRPWHEAVIYELHIGTFTASGDFDGVRRRLDYLVELGVTA